MRFKVPKGGTYEFYDQKKPSAVDLKKAKKFADRFVEFGEEITVDFDTDSETAEVREAP